MSDESPRDGYSDSPIAGLALLRLVMSLCEQSPDRTLDYLYAHHEVFRASGVAVRFGDLVSTNSVVNTIWQAYAAFLQASESRTTSARDMAIALKELAEKIDPQDSKHPTQVKRAKSKAICYRRLSDLVNQPLSHIKDDLIKHCNNGHVCSAEDYEWCNFSKWVNIVMASKKIDMSTEWSIPLPEFQVLAWLKGN